MNTARYGNVEVQLLDAEVRTPLLKSDYNETRRCYH